MLPKMEVTSLSFLLKTFLIWNSAEFWGGDEGSFIIIGGTSCANSQLLGE